MPIILTNPKPVDFAPILQYSDNVVKITCTVTDEDGDPINASTNTLRLIIYDNTNEDVIIVNANLTKSYSAPNTIVSFQIGTLTQIVRQSKYLLWDDTLDIALARGSFPVISNYDITA